MFNLRPRVNKRRLSGSDAAISSLAASAWAYGSNEDFVRLSAGEQVMAIRSRAGAIATFAATDPANTDKIYDRATGLQECERTYSPAGSVVDVITWDVLPMDTPDDPSDASTAIVNLRRDRPGRVSDDFVLVNYRGRPDGSEAVVTLRLDEPRLKTPEMREKAYAVLGEIASGCIAQSVRV